VETVHYGGYDGCDDETGENEDCACYACVVVGVSPWIHELLEERGEGIEEADVYRELTVNISGEKAYRYEDEPEIVVR